MTTSHRSDNRTWLKLALVAFLLVTTLRLDAPPPVAAGTATWTHQTVQAWGPTWLLQQTIAVRITYNAAGNPTYASLLWADCRVEAMFVKIDVTWCGVTRTGPTSFDTGFNFHKEVAWGTAQASCWVRGSWRASGNILRVGFPTASVGATRSGC